MLASRVCGSQDRILENVEEQDDPCLGLRGRPFRTEMRRNFCTQRSWIIGIPYSGRVWILSHGVHSKQKHRFLDLTESRDIYKVQENGTEGDRPQSC